MRIGTRKGKKMMNDLCKIINTIGVRACDNQMSEVDKILTKLNVVNYRVETSGDPCVFASLIYFLNDEISNEYN